jgi:CheY-like chemotaxis protein
MERQAKPVVIVIAEDDDDDFLMAKEALEEARVVNDLYRVKDGEELMDYLLRREVYEVPKTSPVPSLILLDLNMPRKDGREALQDIKANPVLHSIPVVVLTTSKAEEDILRSYELGVNSFIRKPVSFEGFVETMKVLGRYWFEIVELPTR